MPAKVDESRIHNAHLVALLTVKWEWMRLHTTKKKEQQQKKRCVCVLGAVTHTHNKECPTASCVLYTEKKKKTVEWENACVCTQTDAVAVWDKSQKRGLHVTLAFNVFSSCLYTRMLCWRISVTVNTPMHSINTHLYYIYCICKGIIVLCI